MGSTDHREFLEEYFDDLEISCYCVDSACGEDIEDDGYIIAYISKDNENISGALVVLGFEEIKPMLWCQTILDFERLEYFENENIKRIYKYIRNIKEEKIDEIKLKFSALFSQKKENEHEIRRLLELRGLWDKIGNQLGLINTIMRCKDSASKDRIDKYNNYTLLKPETKMIHLPFEFVLFLVKNDADMLFFVINIYRYFKEFINIKAIRKFLLESPKYKEQYNKIKDMAKKEEKEKKQRELIIEFFGFDRTSFYLFINKLRNYFAHIPSDYEASIKEIYVDVLNAKIPNNLIDFFMLQKNIIIKVTEMLEIIYNVIERQKLKS